MKVHISIGDQTQSIMSIKCRDFADKSLKRLTIRNDGDHRNVRYGSRVIDSDLAIGSYKKI